MPGFHPCLVVPQLAVSDRHALLLDLARNTCPGLCLALIGRDRMIKYDLSSTVLVWHIPIGMGTKAVSVTGAARCVS